MNDLTDDLEVGDDGLPIDPVKRQAAVLAQFDDIETEIAALTPASTPEPAVTGEDRAHGELMAESEQTTSEHPAAAWYRRDLERVEGELLVIVRRLLPRVGVQLMAHAVIGLAGSVCGDIIEAQPEARPDLVKRAEHLALHLATIGTRTQ